MPRSAVTHAWLSFAALAALGSLCPPEGVAQRVIGHLVSERSGRPVRHAFVLLVDSAGQERARALTDARGGYELHAPAPGSYRLRTAIIGVRRWTSEPFALAPGAEITRDIVVPLQPVMLDALIVEGRRQCRAIDPDSSAAITRVWEEARKALSAVSWSRGDSLRYDAIHYSRRLSPWNLRPLGGSAWRLTGRVVEPFPSAGADSLSLLGYIWSEPGGAWRHFGPDADVLLSDSFAGEHCFYLQAHPDDPGLLGLAFEPARGRNLPEIEGVLWLDRQTARLRYLEFRYVKLPWAVDAPELGGRVEFERLPTGHWIVDHWRLRMPELVKRDLIRAPRLTALRETGGYVVQFRLPDGTPLALARSGDGGAPPLWVGTRSGELEVQPLVRGIVAADRSGAPVGGATVLLKAPGDSVTAVTLTTPQGWFELRAPGPGTYALEVTRAGYWIAVAETVELDAPDTLDVEAELVALERVQRMLPGSPARMLREVTLRRDSVITLFSYSQADMGALNANSLLDVVAGVPGARVSEGDGGSRQVELNEHRCVPAVYLDGYPSAIPRILERLPLEWLWMVEVFRSESEIPYTYWYASRDAGRCGVVLLWTVGPAEEAGV